jgi:hypothetical protein
MVTRFLRSTIELKDKCLSNKFFLGIRMSEELAQLLWTEKYRPRSLGDVVNQSDIVARLKVFVKEKNMPHLLFTGPPGVGRNHCCSCPCS